MKRTIWTIGYEQATQASLVAALRAAGMAERSSILSFDWRALAAAAPGDTVLLAGKGHETTQDLGDRTVPFDDRVVARRLLGEGAGR